MSQSKSSRKYRWKIAKMMQVHNISRIEAEDIVLKGNQNKAKYLLGYKEKGLWPYGDNDKAEALDHMEYYESLEIPEYTPSKTHSDDLQTVFFPQVSDSIPPVKNTDYEALRPIIVDIVRQELSTALQAMRPTSRPRLKRSLAETSVKTLRCPIELWKRAEAKAKQDMGTKKGLNALVESLLFQYIGEPEDLLES